MNWALLAIKLPGLIEASVKAVGHLKGKHGAEKKEAVLKSIPEFLEIGEYAVGKDLLNDAVVAGLISAYVDAEAAALKAKKALEAGILAKTPQA